MQWSSSELEDFFGVQFTSIPGDPYDLHELRFHNSLIHYLLWVSPARQTVYLQFDDTSVPQAIPLFETSILRCDKVYINDFTAPTGFRVVHFAYTQGAPLSESHLRLSIIKRAKNGFGICTYPQGSDQVMELPTEEETKFFLTALGET